MIGNSLGVMIVRELILMNFIKILYLKQWWTNTNIYYFNKFHVYG